VGFTDDKTLKLSGIYLGKSYWAIKRFACCLWQYLVLTCYISRYYKIVKLSSSISKLDLDRNRQIRYDTKVEKSVYYICSFKNWRMEKVFLFNFDGVVLDNVQQRLEKIYKLLKIVGLEPDEEEGFRDYLFRNWGTETSQLFLLLCHYLGAGNKKAMKMIEAEKKYFPIFSANKSLISSLPEVKKFSKIGLMTNRGNTSLEWAAKKMGLKLSLFDFIQTGDNGMPRVLPEFFDPAISWAESQGFSKNEIVHFGNTIHYDLAPAKSAGIDFVGVCSGVASKDDFSVKGLPPKKIVRLDALPLYLKEMVSAESLIG